MTPDAENRLRTVFRSVFELPGDVEPERHSQGAQGWDSLGHAMLVIALESEFGVSIDATDSLTLTSYDVVRSYLEHRGV